MIKYISIILCSITLLTPQIVFALSPEQKKVFNSGIMYFDVDDCSIATPSSINPTIQTSPGVIKASPEAQAIAHQPISATWGISDSSIEQYFLTKTSVQRLIRHYGLNSSNINEVTNTVKEAGLSPVYFYLYAIEEGSRGEFWKKGGGYINHYSITSVPSGYGDKITDARNDASYLVNQSKIMTSNPSWVDGGYPVDFVPKDIQDAGNADFKNMPSGTIGRAYIPAGAAPTWEYYFPDGRFKRYNTIQDYAAPLTNIIENIKKLGGNPGSFTSNSCSGGTNNGVVGEGLTKVINWAKMIAENNGYGYNNSARRTTGFTKWQSDPNCIESCGDFDCSSFVSAAFTVGGYFEENPNLGTDAMEAKFTGIGFTTIDGPITTDNIKIGDILWKSGHTAIYIGDSQIAHASTADGNDTIGDGSGKEVLIANFRATSWSAGKIFRAPN